MPRLLNFDVVLEPQAGGYRAHVLASPSGQAHHDFALPFTDEGLKNFVLEVMLSIDRARRRVRRIESPERRRLEDFGSGLFEAVFAGPVRQCLERSLLTARTKNTGLRIRLRLHETLSNIPWEYLYDAEHGFLGLSPETQLVRYMELPSPVRPLPITPPLRILAMISAPKDVPEIKGEEEWSRLNDALSENVRNGTIQVDRLLAGSLPELQRALRRNQYHVLHFIGHGYYDRNAEDGALVLEGKDRAIRLVTGRDLGMMLRGHRSLRLAVLNACEGAQSPSGDPFGGVAQVLVRQGIPAVIAMQFEISDPAALVFSHSFYQSVSDGLPIDGAMVEARRSVFFDGNEVEWATPVLYLRSPDGRVFSRGRIRREEPTVPDQSDDGVHGMTQHSSMPRPETAQPAAAVPMASEPLPVLPLAGSLLREPSPSGASMTGRFIMLLDCSASMAGDRIRALNFAIRELQDPLRDLTAENPSYTLLFQALAISTAPWWHIQPTPVEFSRWSDLPARGELSLGRAFSMLAAELSGPEMPTWCLPPTVVLILAGAPTDDWQAGLRRLNDTRWGKHITRLAIAVGKEAPKAVLSSFIGNPEIPILQANNAPSVTNYMRWDLVQLDDDIW